MSFLAVLLSAGILTRMTESAEDIFKQWQRGHLPPVEPVVPVPVEATLGVPLPVGPGYLHEKRFRVKDDLNQHDSESTIRLET